MSSMTTVSECPFSGVNSAKGSGAVFMVYGVLCYVSFVAAFLYAIGFVGNWFVPKSIDSGSVGPVIPSLAVNAALLMVFVLQHTIMARPAFKRVWTRIIPAAAERSTYVLLASASLALVYWQWRPLPQILWQTSNPVAVGVLSALSLAGFGFALVSSCLINHFDLFGLRQTWLAFRNRPYQPAGFKLVGLYRLVRHPLMAGFLIAFWSTPTMSLGHLFFAVMTTLYIFFGTWVEERDLVAEHGERYLEYRSRVRAFVPLPK